MRFLQTALLSKRVSNVPDFDEVDKIDYHHARAEPAFCFFGDTSGSQANRGSLITIKFRLRV